MVIPVMSCFTPILKINVLSKLSTNHINFIKVRQHVPEIYGKTYQRLMEVSVSP